MRRLQLLLTALAVLLFIVADVRAQGFGPPGGGRGGRGGRGGGRRGNFGGGGRGNFGGGGRPDPGQMFDRFANGASVLKRDDLNPFMQPWFDRIAKAAGVTNGQLTRDQWIQGAQQAMGGGNGSGPSAADLSKEAEAEFKKLDQNGDGKLNTDEMPKDLLAQKDRWDTNKDGVIDLQEYTAYYKSTHQQVESAGPDSAGDIPVEIIDEDEKPVVYHAGTIPKDLQPVFSKYDADGDGQISLYEWRSAGGSISDFLAMDRNNDGLVTVEEYMYYQSKQKGGGDSASPGTPSSITRTTANASPAGGGDFNGFSRRRRGRGNRGGGGFGGGSN